MNQIFRNILHNVAVTLLLAAAAISMTGCFSQDVVIENEHVKYVISADGKNSAFVDKTSGIDYIDSDKDSYCASVTVDGQSYPTSAVSLEGDVLTLDFKEANVRAEARVTNAGEWIDIEIQKVEGEPSSLTFINIPLTLQGLESDPFAASVLSMNFYTRVRQLPALQTDLWATCYERFGMEGAKVSLLGVPQQRILPAIRDVMSQAKDIPLSKVGGAWARMSKEGNGSYLMNFGSLNEDNVDEWIKKLRTVGFTQIDSHGGNPQFFKFGSFELNPEKYPDGWDHFKRINKRLHDAGISHIFHTYAFFIDKQSEFVSPVPSRDLASFRTFTLAEPLGLRDSVVVVNESTEDMSATTGFFIQNSRTLRIGDELIEYSGATDKPPYTFTGCKRAANGTRASAHHPGDTAYHLKEMFGLFVPDPESDLFKEIARRTADIVSENGFDGIYLDAIDGSSILDSNETFWYYSTQFVAEIAKHLKRPAGMEMSAMEHHWWHYRSRWQAWDTPRRGQKPFIDLHANSINAGLLLPLQLGWWSNFTWDPPQTEMTFVDDVEYLGSKMIGFDAGLALLGGVEEEDMKKKPLFRRLNAIIKQYEELRHSGYFGEEIKEQLRAPGKEFKLIQESDGSWNFKPMVYDEHKVAGVNHPSSRWTVENTFDTQPLKLRIAAQLSVKAYDDPDNILLADFSKDAPFTKQGTAEGISAELTTSTEKTSVGETTAVFSAFSSGASPRNGSWVHMEKTFEPTVNLKNNQALGVWIHGDGSGALLNLRLMGPYHNSHGARGDHFVNLDFTGWRYFELFEIESHKFYDYQWPNAGSHYNSFLNTVNMGTVDRLQLWYNNLPAEKEVTTLLGPIKAIPTATATIENPTITVGGKKITFPVKMESGMYLEFNSLSDCKLYGPTGALLQTVKPQGVVPELVKGENEIEFTCDGPEGMNPRLDVSIISEGKPLKK